VQPELVYPSDDYVGESPRWDPLTECLWWVDNERATLHRHTPARGDTRTVGLPQNASSVAIGQDGLIATFPDGLHRLAEDGSDLERIIEMDPRSDACSFNDSGVDPEGRLWVGSGSETVRGEGRLWVVSPGEPSARLALDGLSLPNGIGFSPDHRFMYLADSFAPAVYRIPYDRETGTIGEPEEFCTPERSDELPDGLAVDVDGGVWVAYWEGGCVRRYTADGTLDVAVELPVRLAAGCAFGGPHRSDLYVTTAWYGLSETERSAQPLAGALFRIETPHTGVPIALFRAR
jgi:sugar lactone lactonase YvrE